MNTSAAITELLNDVRLGCPQAEDELFAQVYAQLRELAAAKLRGPSTAQTLQPTVLVSEAAYRLLRRARPLQLGSNRWEFFALAARTMRSVMVDYARRRNAQKRTAPFEGQRQELDRLVKQFEASQQVDLLILDEALEQLKQNCVRQYTIVVLKFFGGMTQREISEHLRVSVSTVEKDWQFARTWLRRQMSET